jgi:hypothetical protein
MPSTISNLVNGYTNGHVVNDTHTHGVKKPQVDGFSTRAIHVGSDPDEATGAVIPAISLSTTYKQTGVGIHKVRILPTFKNKNSIHWLTLTLTLSAGLRILSFRQPKPQCPRDDTSVLRIRRGTCHRFRIRLRHYRHDPAIPRPECAHRKRQRRIRRH